MPASAAPPDNDAFAGAIALAPTASSPVAVTGTNAEATLETGEAVRASNSQGAGGTVPVRSSVWYTITPPASGLGLSLDLCGTSVDSVLEVATGGSVDALTAVAGDDDSAGGVACGGRLSLQSAVVVPSVSAGTTYRIRVMSYDFGQARPNVGPYVLHAQFFAANSFFVRASTAPSTDFGSQPVSTVGAERVFPFVNGTADTASPTVARGSGDFLVGTDDCSDAGVAVRDVCGIGARFAPQAVGPRAGTVRVSLSGVSSPLTVTGTGTDEPTGTTGPPGADGATGATGATGLDGATGPAGATGQDGATGATGQDGATGATGQDGATGATGQDGATGATGRIGATGTAGPTGREGATGVAGAGVQGVPGVAGPPGLKGDQGVQGLQGLQGPIGLQGPRGERGGVYRCQRKKTGGRFAVACFVDLATPAASTRSVRVTVTRRHQVVASGVRTLRRGMRRVAVASRGNVSAVGRYEIRVTVKARGRRATSYRGTYTIA